MTNIRQTSLEAYTKYEEVLQEQEMKVYEHIIKNNGVTRNEIAEETGIKISSVCGRVNNMLEMGIIFEGEKKEDKYTNSISNALYMNKSVNWDKVLNYKSCKINENSKMAMTRREIIILHKLCRYFITKESNVINVMEELKINNSISDKEIEEVLKLFRKTKGIYNKYKHVDN